MFINFRLSGCLISLVLLFFVYLLLKVASILFFPVILLFSGGKLWEFFKKKRQEPKEFEPKKGVSYKVCEFCGMKADSTAIRCPRCKKTF